ncbi:MAG TPA: MFS transporter [Stellaceae bacterium]|jgi:MFS family permease|nr:MFS transporter [Stellaceae bacterium]
MSAAAESLTPTEARPTVSARRILGTALGAHILHDGFADLLYVLLPVWQAEFGLALAEIGMLKTVYSGIMAALQVPAGLIAERFGERTLFAAGTAAAGIGYLLIGWSGGFLGLVVCLALGGAGASVQHPLGSSLTARAAEGSRLRTALSVYNFSGDIGKMALPALTALLIALWQWRVATELLGIIGLAAAAAIYLLLRGVVAGGKPTAPAIAADAPAADVSAHRAARHGFLAITAIGIVDATTRTCFLTFLPFLLAAKGADVPAIGLALTLIFAGGATGKFICGVLATRLGILRSVIATECATSIGILALLPLPLDYGLVILPLIGVALNGTSSVLYGTVAELVPGGRRPRAFGIFYTCTIGAGAIAPAVYGLVSDAVGVPTTLVTVALAVLLVLPLTLTLRPALRRLDT